MKKIVYKNNEYEYDIEKVNKLIDNLDWLEKNELTPISANIELLQAGFGVTNYRKFLTDNCANDDGTISANKLAIVVTDDEFIKAVREAK